MSKIKLAASELAFKLSARDIVIDDNQALDFLAAGAGLANRHVLEQLTDIPTVKRINIALLSNAAEVLANFDETKLGWVLEETKNLLIPKTLDPADLVSIEEYDLKIFPWEISEPEDFLDTDRGQAFLKNLIDDLYYTRYQTHQSDRPLDRKRANEMAGAILDVKKEPEDPHWPRGSKIMGRIGKSFNFGYCIDHHWYEEARREIKNKIEAINDELADDVEILDLDDWLEALRQPICDGLSENDDSKPTDLLGEWDKCEVIFILKDDGYLDDNLISSTKNYSEFSELYICDRLQHSLSILGYNIKDYRRISGNRHPHRSLKRGLKKASVPLLTPDELREVVDNACNSNFFFVLYAMVPIKDLIDLDLSKPITFSQAAVGTYNPFNGTFHDVIKKEAITVKPNQGELYSGSIGYSPDDICGLYRPVYYASIRNQKSADSKPLQRLAA